MLSKDERQHAKPDCAELFINGFTMEGIYKLNHSSLNYSAKCKDGWTTVLFRDKEAVPQVVRVLKMCLTRSFT